MTTVWVAVAAGAGLGFVARDLLELSAPAIVLCWLAGAVAGALATRRSRV